MASSGSCPHRNERTIEESVTRDLSEKLTYSEYLHLEGLLAQQQPLSSPVHHDEMLFIIQHQTSELWIRLAIHELEAAMADLRADELKQCLKKLARVKKIQHQLFSQWEVLETLTPTEYQRLRPSLQDSSGFQSLQYRLLEFRLGNKNRAMLEVFSYDPAAQERLQAALDAPSLYDEFLLLLSRRGLPVPAACVDRDWSEAHTLTPELVPVFRTIYENPESWWDVYELSEEFVDIEESFQLWRFRHMKTVERIIGHKAGTGGSSGVGFLRAALDLTFFPELLETRTQLGT